MSPTLRTLSAEWVWLKPAPGPSPRFTRLFLLTPQPAPHAHHPLRTPSSSLELKWDDSWWGRLSPGPRGFLGRLECTRGVRVNTILSALPLLICLSGRGSQPRTKKGSGNAIFPPTRVLVSRTNACPTIDRTWAFTG